MTLLLASSTLPLASAFLPPHYLLSTPSESRLFTSTGVTGEDPPTPSAALLGRREALLSSVASAALTALAAPRLSFADVLEAPSTAATVLPPVEVVPSGDCKKLFNEARALESQGNVQAALRLYAKVVRISPRFVYGWSNLGNAQVALGSLSEAGNNYETAIGLCRERNDAFDRGEGGRRCDDLYVLLLNRGSLNLNSGRPRDALKDLEESADLRGRPDAVILQNRARAREINGFYSAADTDYTLAISMTSNDVAPFWLRAAMVQFQLDESTDAYNLLRRVEVKFPEAPEVRAASAAMLAAKGDLDGARAIYLKIPDRARLKFVDQSYLDGVIAWPPAMKKSLREVSLAVGDIK